MIPYGRFEIPSSLSPPRRRRCRQLRRVLPAGAQLGAPDPGRADARPRPRVGAPHGTDRRTRTDGADLCFSLYAILLRGTLFYEKSFAVAEEINRGSVRLNFGRDH